MGENMVRKILHIDGMTCTSCEMRIENVLRKMDGIIEAKAIYSSSNVYITYDINSISIDKIIEAIEKLDYKVVSGAVKASSADKDNSSDIAHDKLSKLHMIGIAIIILALYTIIKNTVGFNFIPQVNQSMGYGILFLVGLLTSLHCIAMCGGINLSVCMKYRVDSTDSKLSQLKPSAMYNFGRVLSYTVIGGLVGALGSIVSFSGTAKGAVAILSGLFMVIMGLNMLNIFPWLRKLNPRMPRFFGNSIRNNAGKKGPFVVGILNGLMPCGPLQAMQLYALGTGSLAAGALSMFLFSLGTVPLMFGFGAVSSFLSGRFTQKMMKISAVLVMILGIIMLSRGLNLSGYNISYAFAASGGTGNIAKIENGVQTVTTKLESGRYAPIVVQKGIPVKWTIKANKENLNGCNNAIIVQEYGIENKKLSVGDNLVEFTPTEEGNFVYTCWMGMISSNIKVVEDINKVSEQDVQMENTRITDDSYIIGESGNSGGCCAAGSKATKFLGGKIPTDDIQVANIKNNEQEVTITVNDYGYSPAVVVLQKGVKAKIKFNTEKLNSCNNVVVFPEYQGELDLKTQTETPWINPVSDFTFKCWMGMLNGYIKVVDDINNINIDDIKTEVENYTPPAGTSGGGGCCG